MPIAKKKCLLREIQLEVTWGRQIAWGDHQSCDDANSGGLYLGGIIRLFWNNFFIMVGSIFILILNWSK